MHSFDSEYLFITIFIPQLPAERNEKKNSSFKLMQFAFYESEQLELLHLKQNSCFLSPFWYTQTFMNVMECSMAHTHDIE